MCQPPEPPPTPTQHHVQCTICLNRILGVGRGEDQRDGGWGEGDGNNQSEQKVALPPPLLCSDHSFFVWKWIGLKDWIQNKSIIGPFYSLAKTNNITKPNMSSQTYQTENILSQTYQTKHTKPYIPNYKHFKPNLPIQTYPKKLTKPNMSSQAYQTKHFKPNMSNQTYQTKLTKANIPNQTYQTKHTKPNVSNQTYRPNMSNHIDKEMVD